MAIASLIRRPAQRLGIAVIASGLVLGAQPFAIASVAAASPTLTITADRAAAIPAGHNWSYNDFFPRTISVRQGATVRFSIQGFHTSTLLPAGMSATAARVSMGLLAADADDTAVNPNGSPHTQLNLAAAFPIPGGCGSAASPCTFNGTAPISSGAPLTGPIAPLNVKVTAPVGFYRYVCLIHPQMQGWLAVVPGQFQATTPAQLKARVRAQVRADRAAGFAAEKASSTPHSKLNLDGTRTWFMTAGTGSPDGRVTILEMLPRNLTIKRGDKVSWVSRATNEPHTITFPTELHSDMVAMCENGATDTPAPPTVIPPTGPQDFGCNGGPADEVEFGGGNGVTHITSASTVADSGVIASKAELAGFGLPASTLKSRWTVSFAGAARTTYHYLCQIHAGMVGTITVH